MKRLRRDPIRLDAFDLFGKFALRVGTAFGGHAAQVAGLPKPVFLARLGDYGIDTFRRCPADLADEAANA